MACVETSLYASASMPIALFKANWSRIGHLADYFGTVTGTRRADPARHSNLYATVLNELLELAVRAARPDGLMRLDLYRDGGTDRIELAVACEPDIGAGLCDRIADLDPLTADDALHAALIAPDPPDLCIGIWEIIADFGGKVVTAMEGEDLRLIVDLWLEHEA